MSSTQDPPIDLSVAGTQIENDAEVAKWLSRFDVLALFIVVSTAGVIAGTVVENAGRQTGLDSWLRILSVAATVTHSWMLAALVTALLLVLLLRLLFTWPEQAPRAAARTSLALIVFVAGSIAVAAVLGTIAVFRIGDPFTPGGEKAGLAIVYAAHCFLAVTVAVFAAFGFSSIETSAAPESVPPARTGAAAVVAPPTLDRLA